MSANTYRLRIPGPTPVPQRVNAAMAEAMINHRGPEFHSMVDEVQRGLVPLFGGEGPVLLFASSGSGVMEASFVNTIDAGERVLVVSNGQWGERFTVMLRGMGADVTALESEWGQPIDLQRIHDALSGDAFRAVVVTHNESSTGAVTDLAQIGAMVAGSDTLLIVDAVSSLGGMAIDQSRVGADVVFSASQKALMCPPGLGLVSLSEKAWSALERPSRVPRFYWDFLRARASADESETPFTPPVSIIAGLRESLRMIEEEGMSNVFARHTRMANAMRAGFRALGLPSFPPQTIASSTLAVGTVPEGLDGTTIVRHMYRAHETVIAGARNRLRGRIIRIGTMGTVQAADVFADLHALEQTLRSLGRSVDAGVGVAAAVKVLSG